MPNILKPYLILIGDCDDPVAAKTAFGLRDWAREDCLGQVRFNQNAVDLGLPDLDPTAGVASGARTLVLGISPRGGRLPDSWVPAIAEAIAAGLDVASGLHQRLANIPALAAAAHLHGRTLHDVRHGDTHSNVATGLKRPGRRLLTVGTDCALGKKYTALAIAKSLKARGLAADFRATGQTGILIAGEGVAVDAVVADFISGTAEDLSPANAPDHWDVIEGQGSLFHPSYAGVTLGLIHGSQPDALVLCHDPGRQAITGLPHMPVPTLGRAMATYLDAARLTNANVRVVGIALNTSQLEADAAHALLETCAHAHGLPCVDPIRTGVEPIIELLETSSWI